eukprot:NODE_373_length_9849_cov_0.356205.p6 type:complete len:196 gc:universal NODE_373_length_9849_cov_0.356205:6947-7534(+)
MLLIYVLSALLFPKSCDQIIHTYNRHCLGEPNHQQLARCFISYVTQFDLHDCKEEYNDYLQKLNMSTEKYIAREGAVSFSMLGSEPVLYPSQVEVKLLELQNQCRIHKRDFAQFVRNSYVLLYFALQAIHILIYFCLAVVYTIPATFLSLAAVIPFMASKDYLIKLGCVMNYFTDKFLDATTAIAPWNYYNYEKH